VFDSEFGMDEPPFIIINGERLPAKAENGESGIRGEENMVWPPFLVGVRFDFTGVTIGDSGSSDKTAAAAASSHSRCI
jgi:hypothetical protein